LRAVMPRLFTSARTHSGRLRRTAYTRALVLRSSGLKGNGVGCVQVKMRIEIGSILDLDLGLR
jgi:hypothetical protein